MCAVHACPWYVEAAGRIAPPLVLLGVIAIPVLAVGGRRLVAAIGDPHASLVVAHARNVTLGIFALATIVALAVTAWLLVNYPSSCHHWLVAP